MSRLVRLYPRAWRTRYGDELLDLIEARPLGLGGSLDLVRGALDAHRHPELVDASVVPGAVDGPVTRQRYRDLLVARRLGYASIVGGAMWLVAWAVQAAGPMVEEADGSSYRDGSAALPFLMASMILLSLGMAGQLIRLPSRLVVTRLGALVAMVFAPLYGFGPWLLPLGGIVVVGLIVLAIGSWWADAWPGIASVGLMVAAVTGTGLLAFGFLGLAGAGMELLVVAIAIMSTLWVVVGATLLKLPTVVVDDETAPGPLPGPLAA